LLQVVNIFRVFVTYALLDDSNSYAKGSLFTVQASVLD